MIRKIRKEKSGLAMVEFCIAVPFLILLLALLTEFGRMYSTYLRFTNISWEGARFFASLKDPVPACLGPNTSNLSFAGENYVSNLEGNDIKLYQFHRTVQDRVLNMFYYDAASWPIEGTGYVPGVDPILVKELNINKNKPSIQTAYIKNSEQGCTWNPGLPVNDPANNPLGLTNTATVCLSAVYLGIFINIPLRSCMTAQSLENNEIIRIPTQSGQWQQQQEQQQQQAQTQEQQQQQQQEQQQQQQQQQL